MKALEDQAGPLALLTNKFRIRRYCSELGLLWKISLALPVELKTKNGRNRSRPIGISLMPYSASFNAVHAVLNAPCAVVMRKRPNLRIYRRSFIPSSVYVKAAAPNLKITSKFPKKRDNHRIFSGTTENGLNCGPAGWRTSDPSINSGNLLT